MPLMLDTDETLNEAMTALDAAEAKAPEIPSEAFVQTDSELQQSEAIKNEGGDTPNESQPTDTPAAADKKPADAADKTKTETQKPADKQPDAKTTDADKGKSKFAANTERLEKTWKAVNERKTQLDATETQLKQREQAIVQREQKAALAEARAKQKFTPEQYEQAASRKIASADTLALQAEGLERRAEQLENDGKFADAQKAKAQAQDLRDQIAGERYSAKQMQAMAKQLREHPDPTLAQHQATMEQHKKHYLLEAAKQWPDVAKDGSEFQKAMAGHLQAAAQQGLDPNENPILFYHVARLTAAETAAARVSELERKLGEAVAKVKELEALTSPGGGKGSAQRQPENTAKTIEEEEQELRTLALQQG